MARLPDEMVERIKREISVQRLVEARGIKLKRVGKNLMGLCPFHKEKNPSLSVTPSTNKWRCFGCGKGGTVFDWVMYTEGISLSRVLELLRRDLVPVNPNAGPPVKISTVPKLPPLISETSDDKKLLEIVVSFYHKTRDTGQSRRIANFLLSWWNAEACGGFDLMDACGVDREIAADMATAFAYVVMHSC